METEDRVRKALHSVLVSWSVVFLWTASSTTRRRHITIPPIRVFWLLIPCALGMLSCSTGRSPPSTPAKAVVGTHHVVRPGETLVAIGRLYGVPWQTLAQVNRLVDPHRIEVGQSIWIPSPPGTGGSGATTLAVPSRFVPDRRLQWPSEGLISSGFGMRGGRFHGGIDISGERGAPIVAVDEGVVLFSGRGPNGYGNVVMVDHGSGLTTVYAHNERNVVRQGERVRRGQTVALMGDTGRATGTHVHFEVHQHGRLMDPLRWLP